MADSGSLRGFEDQLKDLRGVEGLWWRLCAGVQSRINDLGWVEGH